MKKPPEIRIEMVLFSGDTPTFVEFFSKSDDRTHIISATRFADTFGFTIDELKKYAD